MVAKIVARVIVPSALRKLTDSRGEVEASGSTVRELIDDLERQFPGIRERLLDEAGERRRFINIFVEKEDIRFLKGLETEISTGAEVSIVPAIAGG